MPFVQFYNNLSYRLTVPKVSIFHFLNIKLSARFTAIRGKVMIDIEYFFVPLINTKYLFKFLLVIRDLVKMEVPVRVYLEILNALVNMVSLENGAK